MSFTFKPSDLPEVIIVESKIFPDDRGLFAENYKASDFKANGITPDFVQDNFSVSKKGVIRGLHYQLNPQAQGKLVSVFFGKIWDVAVDVRKSSPNFGKFVGVELSAENSTMLYIPAGFAHGFAVLSDEARVLYKTTNEFSLAHDRGILYSDPALKIPWPVESPIVSAKDQKMPNLTDAEIFE